MRGWRQLERGRVVAGAGGAAPDTPRAEMRAHGVGSLRLEFGERDEISAFKLGWPDQHDWLTNVARHFVVSNVGALSACLGGDQEPELLSARLCWFMAPPAWLMGVRVLGSDGAWGWVRASTSWALGGLAPTRTQRANRLTAWTRKPGAPTTSRRGATCWRGTVPSAASSRTRRCSGGWATNWWADDEPAAPPAAAGFAAGCQGPPPTLAARACRAGGACAPPRPQVRRALGCRGGLCQSRQSCLGLSGPCRAGGSGRGRHLKVA